MNRKWLEENPVTPDIRPPMGANRIDNKAPCSDDELHRIIDACDALGAIEWINDQGEGAWTGEDAKDFIWTLTYTGLRISDVALFDPGDSPSPAIRRNWRGPSRRLPAAG
jgi:integrase